MQLKRWVIISVILSFSFLLWYCAGQYPKVKDVIELSPPQKVKAFYLNNEVKIIWQPSYHENLSNFEGYNIYYSTRSLILSSIKNLPSPIMVNKAQHEVILHDLKESVPYYVHVRSRDKKGNISLPSLPELIVQIK